MSQTSFVPFQPNELGGVIVVNIFAILSTLGLVSVALRITWLLIRRHLLPTPEGEDCVFFNTQLGQYVACLLIAMMFSTSAGIIGMAWAAQRGITQGRVCRFQATLMQIASYGSGYFTVTIAVHTFNSLVLRRRQSVILCRSTMGLGWIVAILGGLIPFMIHHPDGYVYGANGLTCGVRLVYPVAQFFFHILPILTGTLLSAILYSLLFLVLRGTLKIQGGIKLILNPDERWKNGEENYHRFIARVARSMLWYPVAYVTLSLPYSTVCLLKVSGFAVPFAATVFGVACWFSLGIVYVLLFYNTFRLLSPAFDSRSTSAGTRKSMESFYTTERLQKYLTPRAPSTSWEEKINQYRNSKFPSSRLVSQGMTVTTSKSFALDPMPLYLDQSLITDIEETNPSSPSVGRSVTPTFDHYHIIMPPPSASIYSRSNMDMYDFGYWDSSQSRTSSWASSSVYFGSQGG